jgi:hypothetical protein
VTVSSAYEAAAELLCAPTLALVIELGSLSRRHLRLLETARRMDVEMIGVGNIPAGIPTAALSGVRLVSPDALSESLNRLVRQEAGPGAEAVEAPAAPQARLAPAKRPAEEQAEPPQTADWQSEPQPAPQEKRPEAPPALLTPEELKALLEDEQ